MSSYYRLFHLSLGLMTLLGLVSASALAQSGAPDTRPDGVVAQNPAPLPGHGQGGSGQTPSLPVADQRVKRALDELPTTRIGVTPGRFLRLTLREAILMALRNNQDIEVERANVQIAQYNERGSLGSYDPILQATVQFQSSTSPTAQTFIGAEGGAFKRKQLQFTPTLVQNLPTGGNYAITFSNSRETNNAGSAGLSPQYFTTLDFRFTQPLFRNFRSSANERSVKISRKQLTLSDAQFRQRVLTTIASVQSAYWDLVFAIRNLQIQRDAVELADISMAVTRRQVEVGTSAPINVVENESELENRKNAAITALQQITTAENQLKQLILGDPQASEWQAAIEPADDVDFTPVELDVEQALASALRNRPELEQIHLQQELNDIERGFAENQRKPQVDAFAALTFAGLSGTSRVQLPPGSPVLINERFLGGYGTALNNLFSLDFPTYTIGANISFTFRNRTANAAVGRALATGRQLKAQERNLQQGIQVEVRNGLQAVASARQRVEATRAARIAAETQLRGEQQRYAAGLSTTFLILDRQNRLSIARGNEIQALTDYNKAVAQLQRTLGTSLTANGIEVKQSDPTP
ncbi:MAG: TolC family protein [Chloracidobacterium sp.]